MAQRLVLMPRKLVELLLVYDSGAQRLSADERRDDVVESDTMALVQMKETLGRMEQQASAALGISGSLHYKTSLKRHQAKDASVVEGGNGAERANGVEHGDVAERADEAEHADVVALGCGNVARLEQEADACELLGIL